jgi:hypothetical protein
VLVCSARCRRGLVPQDVTDTVPRNAEPFTGGDMTETRRGESNNFRGLEYRLWVTPLYACPVTDVLIEEVAYCRRWTVKHPGNPPGVQPILPRQSNSLGLQVQGQLPALGPGVEVGQQRLGDLLAQVTRPTYPSPLVSRPRRDDDYRHRPF